MKALFATDGGWSMLILRLAAGIVIFPHGAQKALGWFGGHVFAATIALFTQHLHIPLFLTLLVIAAEFLGSLGLIVGFLTRIAAFGLFINFTVAVLMVHIHNGFFMNWTGTKAGEGFEYFIPLLAIYLVLMGRGAGALSIDDAIAKRLE